jgi:pSer/pThr/pTyr-binding forkhead associated (FHA) protein
MPTVDISRDDIDAAAQATKPRVPEGPELSSGAALGLLLVNTGRIVSLVGRDNFTLGREVEGQAVIPDVDLGDYQAYDQGVSRIHAEIRVESEGIYLIDLDSVNGTLVNGNRLEPQTPKLVRHGDIIQLGRLRTQLVSRVKAQR